MARPPRGAKPAAPATTGGVVGWVLLPEPSDIVAVTVGMAAELMPAELIAIELIAMELAGMELLLPD